MARGRAWLRERRELPEVRRRRTPGFRHGKRCAIVPAIVLLCCVRNLVLVVDEPLRIMFLGDSITQGAGSGKTTYATHLCDSLAARGIAFEPVGSVSEWGIVHEGHFGWRADSILDTLPRWTRGKELDIVLCHLGTNDLGHERDVPRDSLIRRTVGDLEAIVDTIRAGNPGVSIYLAQIIPHRVVSQRALVDSFNRQVAPIGPHKSTPHSPVHIVDHFTGFSVFGDLKDDVHPSEAGAVKMAERWLRAMEGAGELEE